jgi:hypothetical protein
VVVRAVSVLHIGDAAGFVRHHTERAAVTNERDRAGGTGTNERGSIVGHAVVAAARTERAAIPEFSGDPPARPIGAPTDRSRWASLVSRRAASGRYRHLALAESCRSRARDWPGLDRRRQRVVRPLPRHSGHTPWRRANGRFRRPPPFTFAKRPTAPSRGCVKTRSAKRSAKQRPSRSHQDRLCRPCQESNDPRNCAAIESSHSLSLLPTHDPCGKLRHSTLRGTQRVCRFPRALRGSPGSSNCYLPLDEAEPSEGSGSVMSSVPSRGIVRVRRASGS